MWNRHIGSSFVKTDNTRPGWVIVFKVFDCGESQASPTDWFIEVFSLTRPALFWLEQKFHHQLNQIPPLSEPKQFRNKVLFSSITPAFILPLFLFFSEVKRLIIPSNSNLCLSWSRSQLGSRFSYNPKIIMKQCKAAISHAKKKMR